MHMINRPLGLFQALLMLLHFSKCLFGTSNTGEQAVMRVLVPVGTKVVQKVYIAQFENYKQFPWP